MYVNAASDTDLSEMIDIVISKHAMWLLKFHTHCTKSVPRSGVSALPNFGVLYSCYTF